MNPQWIDTLAALATQHVWQSAMLLLLAIAMFRLYPLNASTRSWVWLGMLGLAALAPLAVFAPGQAELLAVLPAPAAQTLLVPAAAVALAAPGAALQLLPVAAPTGVLGGASAMLAPVLVLVWLAGLLWNLAQLGRGWRAAVQLRRSAAPAPRLEQLMRRELPGGAVIKVSDQVATPMVVGLLQACILVPRTLADDLSEAVLRDIINHEIAHIRRRDLWVSLAQNVLMAVFWWSPVLRLIGKRLDLAREMACDEHAAGRAGTGKTYAQSLLASIERMTMMRQPPVMAHGMFSSRSSIGQRINGLLHLDQKGQQRARRFSVIAWGAVLITAVTVTFAATPRMAGNSVGVAGGKADAGPVLQLVEAARAGNLALVEQLLAEGHSIDAGADGDGTALIAAAGAGELAMVEALLAKRAGIDVAWSGDGNPLIAAARGGHMQVVARLVAAGANVNAKYLYDETPLINAVRAGRLDVVTYLVQHGADVNLGVRADAQRWRSPLNQARGAAVRSYLVSMGAR